MYNLSVSSIAWDESESTKVADLMQELSIKNVELAPTKLWPQKIAENPELITDDEINQSIDLWKSRGIEPVAMQSMLFLRPDLTIFDNPEIRKSTLEYLKKFIVLSGRMGIKVMVFGSPKNRQKNELSKEEADKIAIPFFRELGDIAAANDVVFCIEPNPAVYNCDYVINAAEGAELVRKVNSQGFRLHLDAAGMALANDDMSEAIKESADILRHFHISAPQLGLIEADGIVDHGKTAKALAAIDYKNIVSIEMRPGLVGENIERVRGAVVTARKFYEI